MAGVASMSVFDLKGQGLGLGWGLCTTDNEYA